MDIDTKIMKVQKRTTIANLINSVFSALWGLGGLAAGVGIHYCQDTISGMIDSVQQADAESYMGGYQLVGGLIGSGAMAIVIGILYLVLLVNLIYFLAFFIENINGYRIVSRLKTESYSYSLGKKIRKNAIYKCVHALLVVIPLLCFVYHMQWFGLLVLIIPQGVVIVLAITVIRLLPSMDALIGPNMSETV